MAVRRKPRKPETSRQDGLVALGVITGARGVRGEVRIKTFTAEPEAIGEYGPLTADDGTTLDLTVTRPIKDGVAARLAGITDRTAAEALRGTVLHVARAALPPAAEDEFYHADLIGLEVAGSDGTHLGVVQAVHDFGAGDLLDVARPDGNSFLLPFTHEAVPEIDLAAGRLTAAPPPGLLETAGSPDRDKDGAA